MTDQNKKSFTIADEFESAIGVRLDRFVADQFPGASRTRVQELIEESKVTVNKKSSQSNYRLRANDEVDCQIEDRPVDLEGAIDIPLDILIEDKDVLVINKPAGLMIHAGAGQKGPTLVNALLGYTKNLSRMNQMEGKAFRPGIIHRLDKETSGTLVIAKNDAAHDFIAKQFAAKVNLRQYIALLNGPMKVGECEIDDFIFRDPKHRTRFANASSAELELMQTTGKISGPARNAKSFFKREQIFYDAITLCSVRIFTGRTHQIRVHAKSLGIPVVGDGVYGREISKTKIPEDIRNQIKSINHHLLHAWVLEFIHPKTQEKVTFKAPVPADFKSLLDNLLKQNKPQKS